MKSSPLTQLLKFGNFVHNLLAFCKHYLVCVLAVINTGLTLSLHLSIISLFTIFEHDIYQLSLLKTFTIFFPLSSFRLLFFRYKKRAEAEAVIKKFNKYNFKGNKLVVQPAAEKLGPAGKEMLLNSRSRLKILRQLLVSFFAFISKLFQEYTRVS